MTIKPSDIVGKNEGVQPKKPLIFTVITPILDRLEPLLRQGINHTLGVERCHLAIDNLPAEQVGKRIAHISDMHFHEKWEPEKMMQALLGKLRIIQKESPDKEVVCLFSGDIVSKGTNFLAVKPHIEAFMTEFHGIFGPYATLRACEGNHDILRPYWNEEKAFLETLGFDYSEKSNHGGVEIVSTPDFTVDRGGTKRALAETLQDETPTASLRIILSHNLEVLSDMDIPHSALPQIIMGGHTHAGHAGIISDPSFSDESDLVRRLMARVLLGYKYPLVSGVKKLANNIFISVSPGAGENEKRPRLNAERGISVFTLQRSPK